MNDIKKTRNITLPVQDDTYKRFNMFRAMRGLGLSDIGDDIIETYLNQQEDFREYLKKSS